MCPLGSYQGSSHQSSPTIKGMYGNDLTDDTGEVTDLVSYSVTIADYRQNQYKTQLAIVSGEKVLM